MLGTSALEKDSLFVTNNDMSFFFLFITQHLSGNSGSQILKSYSIEIAEAMYVGVHGVYGKS